MARTQGCRNKIARIAGTCVSIGVAAAFLAGCTSTPTEYGATLSSQDPKWTSPQCVEARQAATDYKEKKLNWGAGMLIGPYGLALVAAGKEHQAKQRKLLAREMHMKCSSQPLPKNLQADPSAPGRPNVRAGKV